MFPYNRCVNRDPVGGTIHNSQNRYYIGATIHCSHYSIGATIRNSQYSIRAPIHNSQYSI